MIQFLYNYTLTRKPSKKSNPLNLWLQWQLHKYLKANLAKYYKNIPLDILGIDATSNVIVSLTTFPARIEVVYLAIKSILNQSIRPKKVVLWLGKEQFSLKEEELPKLLLELKPLGLEIEFCEDLKAHKKYFFAFQKYPEHLIVTIDDDVIYPKDLLKILLDTHQLYPNCVVANRVRFMEMESKGFKPYRGWEINREGSEKPSKTIFSTGVGGVLYEPSFFLESFFDIQGIKETDCMNDDIWLKAGQIVNNVPVVFTDFYFKPFFEIPESQKESLFLNNVFENDNDRQIIEVFKYFGITQKSFE